MIYRAYKNVDVKMISALYGWELPVLHYHKETVSYPYPYLVVITQLFSWIIFINDCIFIFTGSLGWFFSWSYMLYRKLGVKKCSKLSQRNGKLPLSRQKQGNYPVFPVYAVKESYLQKYLSWRFYVLTKIPKTWWTLSITELSWVFPDDVDLAKIP